MPFKLDDSFIEEFAGKQPNWGPLGYVVYKRTYSRQKLDGTGEEFWETVRRVVEGVYQVMERHVESQNLPWRSVDVQAEAQEMYRRIWDMKFLPPGRSLWAMGTPIIDKVGSAALMNCGFVSTKDINTDFAEPFCWLMDMLMLGAGVGFDVLGEGEITVVQPRTINAYTVDDSREGWTALLRVILNSYVGIGAYPSYIDFSQIRSAGTPLKTFGGVAAGSRPLKDLVADICAILDPLRNRRITSSAIVDLANVIGKCVVSGNIRRSSEIALGPDTDEFLSLKDPQANGPALLSHRWASNNSIVVSRGHDYRSAATLTAKNGEPGYVWMDNTRTYGRMGDTRYPDPRADGWNPCGEQPLEHMEMCCLVETFPAAHDSLDDYWTTLQLAYTHAKLVSLIPTHNPNTNEVMARNFRIGISQSGISQSFAKHGKDTHFAWSDAAYEWLREYDKKFSDHYRLPTSIKLTTVKPSGTVSLLAGATPGVHYPHSEYYNRTVRMQSNSDLLEPLREAGYRIEDDVYSPNTVVVYFPIHEEYFDRSKSEVSMWEQLENVAQMQEHWSDNGVSATITFSRKEADQIANALELYESRLKTISFLPLEDHGYEQAPYIEITAGEYDGYVSTLNEVDWSSKYAKDQQDMYCDGEACLIRR